jgi:hypothetical protein
VQAGKGTTARLSTFHFARASQKKKSLPLPTANQENYVLKIKNFHIII